MKNTTKKKIIVNFITSLRIIGTILAIPLYIKYGSLILTIILGIIFTSDFIDGFLARSFHVETFFGSILDGLSDKALAIVILCIISSVNPIYIFSIIFELTILIINFISIENGNNAQSSIIGKGKTILLDITLVLSIFVIALNDLSIINKILSISLEDLLSLLIIPSVIAQIITIKDYYKKANYQKMQRIKKEQIKNKKARLKNKNELLHALFDTEYYHQHKEDSIKELFYIEKQ